MTIREIIDAASKEPKFWIAAFLVFSTLIEITPIKINPWSALFKWIGIHINVGMMKKFDEIEKKVVELDCKFDTLQSGNEEDRAVNARYRILRFADDLYYAQSNRYSKEHFEQILDDIKRYDTYCKEHPLFENNKTVLATKKIKDTYEKCINEHSFLK